MAGLNDLIYAKGVPTAAKVNPTAEIESGKLIGFHSGNTNCFFGVPYAKANRFEKPEKADPWEGYRYAQSYGEICPIPAEEAVGGNEFLWQHRFWIQNERACHNLNIWTPTMDPQAAKPVIVFYHGGGYVNGSAIEAYAYDGQNLSETCDAVVITVNHRLNILAFLDMSSFGEKYVGSANNESRDILRSLEWIRDNIAQFGGDPANVTIFGQSAGGQDIESMLRCPSAQGLYKAAGIVSGHNPMLQSNEGAARVGELTTQILGLTPETIDEIQTMDYHKVYAAAQEALQQARSEGNRYWFSPCADGFLQAEFCDYVKDMPIFIGTVFSEFQVCFALGDQRHSEWTPEETMGWLVQKFGTQEKSAAALESYHKLFPGKPDYCLFFLDNMSQFVVEQVNAQLCNKGASVYSYLFAYESPVNGSIVPFHCYDLYWWFCNVDTRAGRESTGADQRALALQDEMVGALKQLLHHNVMGTPSLPWEAFTPENHKVMIFDNERSECRDWSEYHNYVAVVNG